ncbi:hypothetical protein DN730_10940 [Marinomonas piezotolerans]|uniref:Uncharacterized protein n=1 Tax=Marinomonas piezotolerans TaxID=2213058 RepID=A0A370U8N6_9GAMM|nr:hypothetical protein [Marinomonas piezotolerans]RDL44141.1 hypothetical protein DN730_10940 [Marinomonas piezotolerans]
MSDQHQYSNCKKCHCEYDTDSLIDSGGLKYDLESPTWDMNFKQQFDITLSAFEDADREFLVKYAQKYLALEYKTTQFDGVLDKLRIREMKEYLQRESLFDLIEDHKISMVEVFEYLLMQTRYFSELIRLDSIVMRNLSETEPEIYKKVINARKKNSHFSPAKNLGVYNSKGYSELNSF